MKLHRLILSKLYGRLDALKAENNLLRNQSNLSLDQIVSIEYAPLPLSPLFHRNRTLVLPLDKLMIPIVLRKGSWDESMLEFARRVLNKPGTNYYFYDVGANVGLVTRQFLAQFPAIIGASCFEPDPDHFALLKRNNDVFEKVSFFPYALSNNAGKSTFYRDSTNIGRYSLLSQAVNGPQTNGEIVVECLKVTDDLLLTPVPADARLIWKSDTEGYDEIIASELSMAFWARVDLAIMELLPVKKPMYDVSKFKAILDSFPKKYFSSDLAKEMSTSQILEYISHENVPHRNLYMAK
jgi:FkbM family methyltransferase